MILIYCSWVSTRWQWSVNVLFPSLSTASIHLPMGFPTGLLPAVYPFCAFLVTFSTFILITCPTHWSLLNLIKVPFSNSPHLPDMLHISVLMYYLREDVFHELS